MNIKLVIVGVTPVGIMTAIAAARLGLNIGGMQRKSYLENKNVLRDCAIISW